VIRYLVDSSLWLPILRDLPSLALPSADSFIHAGEVFV
jgi:hypothetical protein